MCKVVCIGGLLRRSVDHNNIHLLYWVRRLHLLFLALLQDRLRPLSFSRRNSLASFVICSVRVVTCFVNASTYVVHGFYCSVVICGRCAANTKARLFTSCIRSACSATSCKLSPFLVAKIACVFAGSRASHSVVRSSSETLAPASVDKCRRNCDGFLSPISSLSRSCLIRCSCESVLGAGLVRSL